MNDSVITEKDRKKAQGCLDCPVCNRARKKQKGLAYMFVKFLERGLCPNCKAYEKVYGRKAHEPRRRDENGIAGGEGGRSRE